MTVVVALLRVSLILQTIFQDVVEAVEKGQIHTFLIFALYIA